MIVTIESIDRGHMSIGDFTRHYKYRARWTNDGIPFVDSFRTKKELKEYFTLWDNVTFVEA